MIAARRRLGNLPAVDGRAPTQPIEAVRPAPPGEGTEGDPDPATPGEGTVRDTAPSKAPGAKARG